ncbi:MFS transporter [Nostoc sp. 'Peltigera membranacea cyanobiont' 213]|uniref:MFS transporter n=1 Tax=Nostoc sp. 'Peltigera membranacea cyanobiont' 213 TaxID=2014530 RepID=UPI000B953674|nr:MFS transporter [Nostoc sp. 'Peltigera membranacea cyanobiont' 213]OYD87123.1 MFS transporter [Nostoc sp. 'Peltigera membranacea cyanobiont' 213]
MRIFIFIWLGQMLSLIGSSLTSFALGIWVYQNTNSVTLLGLILLSATLPSSLISPVAGVLVDRWQRRWVMIISDFGAGLSTLAIALLFFTLGKLEIWHICVALAISSGFSAFQLPAYNAATTLLVSKQYLARASGMIQLGRAVAQLLSPMLGGLLLVTIQLQGIIVIDFLTFFFGIIPLLLVRFPELKITNTNHSETIKKSSLLQEVISGWNYITARPGLLGLLMFFTTSNLLLGAVEVLITPLVLSFTSPAVLGTMTSVAGIGLLLGSLIITTYGGPQRLIHTVIGFQLLGGLCIMGVGLRASVALITLAAFLFFLGWPIINACAQVIFQKKVALDVQGRVFAIRQTIADASFPLAYIVAGPLADKVFEPLMVFNGPLAGNIGQIIGIGKGRGIGLMFIIIGTLSMLVAVAGYQYPRLRLVEDELPDVI